MLRRKALKRTLLRQTWRDTGPDEETRERVYRRDAGRCRRCTKYVSGQYGRDWDFQHRLPRGMGGTSRPDVNSPANLVTACRPCHAHVERFRIQARQDGWLIPKGLSTDIAARPILLDGKRVAYLTHDCEVVDDPPGEVAS